jgi:DNA modification methylase
VLKPGGHILAFFGTRTYDIGTMAIRLAGFEIRDQIQWIYGSGFPKSLNVSKKIEQDIDNLIYNNIWKNKLDNVKIVEPTLKKSQIEVGNNMKKQNSAQENVAVIVKEKLNYQNVIVVESNSTEVHHILRENLIVQESVGQFIIQQQDLVKCVEQLDKDQIVKLLNIFIVEESVKDMLREHSMNKIKVEEVQKTLNGNEKFYVLEIIPVLCAILPKILKHIILNQSRTFQNLDTKLQMDCVSATSVTITKSTMEHLIGNTVSILKEKINFTIDNGHSALKPANEPICVARKPLSEKSVAENVLKWGTGGINVDGCRISSPDNDGKIWIRGGNGVNARSGSKSAQEKPQLNGELKIVEPNPEGRFPANIILECICDEVIKGEKGEPRIGRVGKDCDNGIYEGAGWKKDIEGKWPNDKGDTHTNPNCPCRLLDEQSGFLKGDNPNRKPRKGGHREQYVGTDNNEIKNVVIQPKAFDSGGASRFFYQAKVSKAERNMGLDSFEDKDSKKIDFPEKDYLGSDGSIRTNKHTTTKNSHPTVKPINLMAYLCRLITPEGGIVLDPFCGSGSTGVAALLEGFRFVGMEQDKSYFDIASARIESYEKYKKFKK